MLMPPVFRCTQHTTKTPPKFPEKSSHFAVRFTGRNPFFPIAAQQKKTAFGGVLSRGIIESAVGFRRLCFLLLPVGIRDKMNTANRG
jgi:hypothetical protein